MYALQDLKKGDKVKYLFSSDLRLSRQGYSKVVISSEWRDRNLGWTEVRKIFSSLFLQEKDTLRIDRRDAYFLLIIKEGMDFDVAYFDGYSTRFLLQNSNGEAIGMCRLKLEVE